MGKPKYLTIICELYLEIIIRKLESRQTGSLRDSSVCERGRKFDSRLGMVVSALGLRSESHKRQKKEKYLCVQSQHLNIIDVLVISMFACQI